MNSAGWRCAALTCPCYSMRMEAPDRRAGPEEPHGEAPGAARLDRTGPGSIDAILAGGRATRRRPSRATWIAAALVGAVCAIGFVLLFVGGGAPAEPSSAPTAAPAPAPRDRGAGGCIGGLGLGLGIGIAIGFALARRQGGDHSSRRRP